MDLKVTLVILLNVGVEELKRAIPSNYMMGFLLVYFHTIGVNI